MSSSYNDQGTGNTVLVFGPPVQGAVRVMMIICAVIFLLLKGKPGLLLYLALIPDFLLPWQLVTATFCHTELMHVAFNCFGIWIFGSLLEDFWGTKKFVIFFMVTSTIANTLWLISCWLFPVQGTVMISIGASGGIFALLFAYGYFWPNKVINAFWLFPMRAKTFVAIFAFLELYFALVST